MAEEIDNQKEEAVVADVGTGSSEVAEIDAILQEEDPQFLKELNSINADNLNGQEIGLPPPEELAKMDKWYINFWLDLEPKQRLLFVLGSFSVFVAVPAMLIAIFGGLTPEFKVASTTSIAHFADETITLAHPDEEKNLFDLFFDGGFFLALPEQVYYLKPKRHVNFGRFAFYLELGSSDDVPYFEKNYEEVTEAIGLIIKQHDVDDFKGVQGKEEMRKKMLAAINARIETKIKNIRYKLIVFN